MKKLLVAFFLLPFILSAQDDLSTPDGMMRAFYSCLDVKKGGQIDSARFMQLFWPGAQLDGVVQSRRDTSRMVNFRITPQEYLKEMKGFTATHRFREWELGRKSLAYGHLQSVFSAYELIDVAPNGDTTSLRGINTFQLFFDGTRWWITYCSYEEETPKNPLPAEYTRTDYKRKE